MIDWRTTHGWTNTREYRVWHDMRQRCNNPKNSRYEKYGARGISVCDRWQDFSNFISDMGSRPGPEYSIDRINNDGNYEPSNCRWATRSVQQRNKGKTKIDHKLPRGDAHWTRRDKEKAVEIARVNIKKAHGCGKNNPNAKMSSEAAAKMRNIFANDSSIKLDVLGGLFGVGRETARKVVRGIAWQ
ncbi:homing endonuclease [Caudoviricetes sp.]|nr:homing endonuclease [Caudoviricetes sp.]UOF81497.1 homing endonuclease [Caudoviricetes sp.]